MKKKVILSFIVLVSMLTHGSRLLLGMEMEIDGPDLTSRETSRQLASKMPGLLKSQQIFITETPLPQLHLEPFWLEQENLSMVQPNSAALQKENVNLSLQRIICQPSTSLPKSYEPLRQLFPQQNHPQPVFVREPQNSFAGWQPNSTFFSHLQQDFFASLRNEHSDLAIRDDSTSIYDEDNLIFINDVNEISNKRKYDAIINQGDSAIHRQQKTRHSITIGSEQKAMPLQKAQVKLPSIPSTSMFSRVKADRKKQNEEARKKRKEIEAKTHEKQRRPNLRELTFNREQLLQEISQSRFHLSKNSKETTALQFKTKTCEFMVYMPDIDENIFKDLRRNNKDFLDDIRKKYDNLERQIELKTNEMADENKVKLQYSDLFKKKRLLYITLLNNGFPDNLTGELKNIIDNKTYFQMNIDNIINKFALKDNILFSVTSKISQHIGLRSSYYQNGDIEKTRTITAYHTEILQDLKNAHLFYKLYTTIMICLDKFCNDGLIVPDLKKIILNFLSDCSGHPRLIEKSEK